MKWQLKFLSNAALDYLPLFSLVRKAKRKLFPYTGNPDVDSFTIEQGILQVEALRKACGDLKGKSVLELGTGWHPFIPILFSLCGCASIHMVDEQRLMDASTFRNSLRNLTRFRDQISQRLGIDAEALTNALRVDSGLDLSALLSRFRMKYLAPADARHLNLPNGSQDIITSRAVLEHIPPTILQSIFAEFRRIIAPDGSMCHIIDNSDHWEHGDKSISRVNFLKFEVHMWKLISLNRLDYQNRLRHSDYLQLIQDKGFSISADFSKPDPSSLAALKDLKLAQDYANRDPADLAVLTSFIIAKPMPNAGQAN